MKVFVASSGRCGTGFLASGLKRFTNFPVFHEQAPVLRGELLEAANSSEKDSRLEKKVRDIRKTPIYFDTAHQFMRGLHDYVLDACGDVRVIKLARDPLEVVASRLNRGVIPGKTEWLGNFDDDKNVIKLPESDWQRLTDAQKIMLDWIEHEERYWRVQDRFSATVLVSFEALTKNTGNTFKRIFKTLGIKSFKINNMSGLFINANQRPSRVRSGWQVQWDQLVSLIRELGHELSWLETDFYRRVVRRHDVYEREQKLLPHYNKNTDYSSVAPDWAAKRLPFGKLRGKRVLDLGCGDGRFSAWLKDNLGCEVVGVDFSNTRIAKARSQRPDIPFHCDNAYDYAANYKGKAFDWVLMTEFIEHLENPEGLLDSLQGISGGIIGTVPRNFPYVAHLQVFKTAKEFRERFPDWGLTTKLGGAGPKDKTKSTIFFYGSSRRD